MLELDSVRVERGAFVLNAGFSISAGQIAAIMGPSGAGKSTLVEAIAGFAPVAAGRILWNREDMAALAPGARPVATLFQDGNLFPHLTVAQNAGLGIAPRLRLSGEERDRVEATLERVGLDGLAGRLPATLSGGQRSRAALARALLQDRPILLLDEPFAALGPALRDEMLDLVARLATESRATTLMVTHRPGDARRIAESALVVANGEVGRPVGAGELLDNPPPSLQAYLGRMGEPATGRDPGQGKNPEDPE